MKHTDERQAGFTLTELLVVLLILSLIAAAITPQIMGRLDSSKVRAAKLQLETLSSALDMYKIDNGTYPRTEHGLDALLSPPDGMTFWDGPYVRSSNTLIDPWRQSFKYEQAGQSYILVSLGADGIEGGESHDADLQFPMIAGPTLIE
ncbi:MAG: type II secretion system major pseudopilin GspG [Pseudomonadota bacterium]